MQRVATGPYTTAMRLVYGHLILSSPGFVLLLIAWWFAALSGEPYAARSPPSGPT